MTGQLRQYHYRFRKGTKERAELKCSGHRHSLWTLLFLILLFTWVGWPFSLCNDVSCLIHVETKPRVVVIVVQFNHLFAGCCHRAKGNNLTHTRTKSSSSPFVSGFTERLIIFDWHFRLLKLVSQLLVFWAQSTTRDYIRAEEDFPKGVFSWKDQ